MKRDSNKHRVYSPEEIAEWICRYRAGGLGLSAFAEHHGLSRSRLHYWVYDKRFSKLAKAPAPLALFQEVKLPDRLPFADWAAEVSLSSGMAVRFSGTVAPAWIGAVVERLRQPC
jgi:transposase-like protein